jgi:hypothetical protein
MLEYKAWLIIAGLAAVELLVLWMIFKALRSGVVTINFGDSSNANDIFNVTARRATGPIVYWIMIAFLAGVALIFAAVIFGYLHGGAG